jgi:hypothetical protein
VWAIRFACNFIPILGPFVNWVIRGVLIGGLFLVYLKRIRREPASFEDLFSGFQSAFLQLALVGLVSGVLSLLAATPCCLVLPGLYLFIAWLFAIPLVAIDIFPELQRILVSNQPDVNTIKAVLQHAAGTSLWLIIVVNAVSFFNFPFVIGALAHAYEDLFGARRTPSA